MALTKIRKEQVLGLVEQLREISEQIKTYREPVALLADLPLVDNNEGDIRVCLEDKNVYVWADGQWHINTVKGSLAKTIFLSVENDNQELVYTGIRYDEVGDNRTNSDVINLYLNGVLVEKVHYEIQKVDNQMVIKWLSTDVPLEQDDLIAIQFYDITGGLKLNLGQVGGGSGSGSGSGSIGNSETVVVSKAILPETSKTVDIGSEQLRFRSIYVDEAHLDANTLYIDGVPVLGSNSDTILVKADPDQGIAVKTSGAGTTKVMSENNVEVSTNGMNADVNLKAIGTDSKINITGTSQINMTAPVINMNGELNSASFSVSDLTVRGNLKVQGTTTTVESQNLTVKDNIIEVNKGEIGNGVTLGRAGLKVDRGDEEAYFMVFDETEDMFMVGMQSQLEIIASRNYVDQKIGEIGSTGTGSECSIILGTVEW